MKYFIAGTDTDVGKTVIAAGLLKGAQFHGDSYYWKPIQSGTDTDDDTVKVGRLSGAPAWAMHAPQYRFRAPVSPHLAAEREGRSISLGTILQSAHEVLSKPGSLFVEGAGGLLVPLAPGVLQIDLIAALGLPVLLVVGDKLGAINHTLLSIEACQRRRIPVMGVILNRGAALEGNGESIETYGNTRVLARFMERTTEETAVEEIAEFARKRASFVPAGT